MESKRQESSLDLEEVKPFLNEYIRMRVVPRNGMIHYGEINANHVCYTIKGSYFNYRIAKNGKVNLLSKIKAPEWSCVDKVLDADNSNIVEAKALEECVVLDIDGEYFINCIKENGELGVYFMKKLLTLVSVMSVRSDYLLFSDAKEHLMFYILEYFNHRYDGSGNCKIDMKNDYIAAEIGISTRTLYRIQNVLKSEGIISVKNSKIIVNEMQIKRIRDFFSGYGYDKKRIHNECLFYSVRSYSDAILYKEQSRKFVALVT